MSHVTDRYSFMPCRRSGRSGLILPELSIGLWHNFGSIDSFDNAVAMLRRAFDLGIFMLKYTPDTMPCR